MAIEKGIGIASPMRRDYIRGYWKETTTSLETAKSNLRNLLLTVPGERLMRPDLGLNPKDFLFENNFAKDIYRDRVHAQVSKYMPYISVQKITIKTYDDDPTISVDKVYIKLQFRLKDFEDTDSFVEHLF